MPPDIHADEHLRFETRSKNRLKQFPNASGLFRIHFLVAIFNSAFRTGSHVA